jgi:hypothetical protein
VVQARQDAERLQVLAAKMSVFSPKLESASSPEKLRVAWLEAFDQMVALNTQDSKEIVQAAPAPPAPRSVGPDTPSAGPVEPRLMLKVWGVPVHEKESEEKVNLAKYDWSPRERFFLYCETAVPVNIGLYSEDADNRARKILPDEKAPGGFDVLKPGKPYKLGATLALLDNPGDETLRLVVVLAGSRPDAAARQYLTGMDGVAPDGWQKKVRLRATCDPNPNAKAGDGSKTSSPSVKDVAILVASPETAGYVPIVLKKKKN